MGTDARRARLSNAGRTLAQTLRLMVGVPDYGRYLEHMARTHPQLAPMDYGSFLRNRQQARYGGGLGRCC